MGLEAPSPAWLARIFRQEGVARAEPSKRPRAAWRRFDLPRPQRLPAARRHRVRPGRRAQGGDLPAPGRPLPPGGGLPGRPGRWPARRPSTSSTRARPPGARTRRPRGRQRRGPGPQPARSHRPPGGARALPGRRTPRRQTLQAHHPGQERALRPDPAPLPGPAAPGRLHRRAPGAGRPLRPHPATPSAPTRACPGASPRSRPRTPPRWPGHPDRATTPTPSPPAANPRATRPPGADRRTGAGPSPPAASAKPAITRNGTVHIGGIAFLVRRALAGHRTTAIRDATTITFADVHGEVLIQYNWPPEGVTRVSHHPPDPTNQRARPRPQEAPTVTEVLTHRTSPMS